MLLRLAAAAAIVTALAGCGGSAKKTATASQLPPGCTVAETDGIVTAFLRNPSFAQKPDFDVYASYESDGRSFVVADIPGIIEVSRVIQLTAAKQDFNHARITFQLTRHAPDYVARGIHARLVRGGGTIDCAHQLVAAWVTKGP